MSDNLIENIVTEILGNPVTEENITSIIAEVTICNIFKEVPEETVSVQLADAVIALARFLDKDSKYIFDLTVKKGDELLKEWNKDEETRSTFIEYVNTKYLNRSKMH